MELFSIRCCIKWKFLWVPKVNVQAHGSKKTTKEVSPYMVVFPSFHEVPGIQNSGCEGTGWGCYFKLFLFLSSPLDFAAGQLETGYRASWIFGVAKCLVLLLLNFEVSRQIIPACQICRCMLYEALHHSCFLEMLKVNGKKLVLCFTGGDWKMGDSWSPIFLV